MKLNNTLTRTLVAVIAIPFVVAACYIGKLLFLVLVLGIGLLAFHEFATMAANKKFHVNKSIGFAAVAAIILNYYTHFADFDNIVLILIPLIALIELFRNKDSAIANLGATLLGIFYIGLFAGAIIIIREFFGDSRSLYDEGGFLVISMLASIWVCDSAAFFIGSALGKHKMFPRVSPKKSWEGAVAGFVFSVITMIAAKALVLDFLTLPNVIIIGLIVGIFGQAGDLIESLFKRDAGVKDSSSLIPGHGGIFDRFDSLLYSAPLVALYLRFFVQ